MTSPAKKICLHCVRILPARILVGLFWTGLLAAGIGYADDQNLLRNPGFEEPTLVPDATPNWTSAANSAGKVSLTGKEAHGGQHALAIPAHTAAEQRVDGVAPGAYVARCWVKSESEQPVTVLLRETERPWAAYTCAEITVPQDQWVQLETFCPVDRAGSLTFTLGGMSQDFRFYHGAGAEMGSPILADDFELIRYEPRSPPGQPALAVWDAKKGTSAHLDWSPRNNQWAPVEGQRHTFTGTPIIQARQLVGLVAHNDGGLAIYALSDSALKPRCSIVPVPAIPNPRCTLVRDKERSGIRVGSRTGDRAYTAWFTPKGLVRLEATHVAKFEVRDCRLRYGLLPSFVGTDLCYAAEKMRGSDAFNVPSTQWLVGLVDGNDSMLVAVWDTDAQAVSLGLSGTGENRLIDSLSIGTDKGGFSLSFVEHSSLWHREALQEDWLGEYVPIKWMRPFPARWMSHFFVTPGGSPSFRQPCMDYSFPAAYAKTRMWGVWFEDWNHYPFYFDGPRTILHFEKTFVPNGDALFYFLEPAAADLYSPCEIVEQALGPEKAAALFDFDANRLRKLRYSTPDLFMYDRPVCATTTRLSKVKQEEKATVGVNLATHLYEFIREIRSRVDQYTNYFGEMRAYFATEQKTHPDLRDYLTELDGLVAEVQAKSAEVYATPLSTVQRKTDAMKQKLEEGKGDGFDCGELDVRTPAGTQDDLCRRYNRLVMRLAQTAAYKCGDSPHKAIIAKYVWDQSRAVLRQPTRWEPRRTLYFFEP